MLQYMNLALELQYFHCLKVNIATHRGQFLPAKIPVRFHRYLLGPLHPHRLLVVINPFGRKKKGRKIFHPLVAPLFELAGISSHVTGERQHVHAQYMATHSI